MTQGETCRIKLMFSTALITLMLRVIKLIKELVFLLYGKVVKAF